MTLVLSAYNESKIALEALSIERFSSSCDESSHTIVDIRTLLDDHSTKFHNPVFAFLRALPIALQIDELVDIKEFTSDQIKPLPHLIQNYLRPEVGCSVILDEPGDLILLISIPSAILDKEDAR